jgi:hypothetical protein
MRNLVLSTAVGLAALLVGGAVTAVVAVTVVAPFAAVLAAELATSRGAATLPRR